MRDSSPPPIQDATEKPGHLMSLNDPKWRYLLISSINFSSKISLARLARAYQPTDFTAEKKRRQWAKRNRARNKLLQIGAQLATDEMNPRKNAQREEKRPERRVEKMRNHFEKIYLMAVW